MTARATSKPAAAAVCAIVTARGGSKGLPRKNLRLLGGKPLIAHSILAALACKRVGRCVVTTEDPEIKKAGLKWGAEVIDRPAALATDGALSRDVVRHALATLDGRGELPEVFVLLQPTSPLRTAAHLEACLSAFLASSAACAVSVTEEPHSPYKDFVIEGGLLKPLFGADGLEKPRQALPSVYRPNGAIYAMRSRLFLERMAFYVEPAIPFFMKPEESVDIDTELDLTLAEATLRGAPKTAKRRTA